MCCPTHLDDLQKYIDSKTPESIHLDYKRSAALTNTGEVSKDVSAFANSDGGLLIYGMVEEDDLPVRIDDGVEASTMTRERLEQIIRSNISPIIEGVTITQIQVGADRSVFCVQVPRSSTAPHQDAHRKKYYKRYNFELVPMQDYEINDVRTRVVALKKPVRIGVDTHGGFLLHLFVENRGGEVVEDLEFLKSSDIPWRNPEEIPQQWQSGIRYLHPGQRIDFLLDSAIELFRKKEEGALQFEIRVHYHTASSGEEIEDRFPFDLEDLRGSAIVTSEMSQESRKLREKIGDLVRELGNANRHLDAIASLASPTGLLLSVRTQAFLKSMLDGSVPMPRIPLDHLLSPYVFAEVLGVDLRVAARLHRHFLHTDSVDGLEDIEGVDEGLVKKIKARFLVEDGDSMGSGSSEDA